MPRGAKGDACRGRCVASVADDARARCGTCLSRRRAPRQASRELVITAQRFGTLALATLIAGALVLPDKAALAQAPSCGQIAPWAQSAASSASSQQSSQVATAAAPMPAASPDSVTFPPAAWAAGSSLQTISPVSLPVAIPPVIPQDNGAGSASAGSVPQQGSIPQPVPTPQPPAASGSTLGSGLQQPGAGGNTTPYDPSTITGPSTPAFVANTVFPPAALSGGGSSTPAAGTVFQDNFANGIDTSNWGYNYPWSDACNTNHPGMGNFDPSQDAAYMNPDCSSQNSADVFSTGVNGLDIAIKPTPAGVDASGESYITGQIRSQQAYTPGHYFEMTATLPTTTGVGAAFWLIPQDGSWPPELDVMENLGQDPNTVYSTIHSSTTAQQQVAVNVPRGVQSPHKYGVYWGADTTTF